MIRVRIMGEGGGLEQWTDFHDPDKLPGGVAERPYVAAALSLGTYSRDVDQDPDVIHPRSLTIMVEPIPVEAWPQDLSGQ